MAKPNAIQVYLAQYNARQAGNVACPRCLAVREPDGRELCYACRAKAAGITAEQRARYNENRNAARKARRRHEQEERAHELELAGLGPCPRCHRPKPLYDRYSLCELCREYLRLRARANPRPKAEPETCERCGAGYSRHGLHLRAVPAQLCPTCYASARLSGQLRKEASHV